MGATRLGSQIEQLFFLRRPRPELLPSRSQRCPSERVYARIDDGAAPLRDSPLRLIQKRQTTPTWVPPRRRIALTHRPRTNNSSPVPLRHSPAQISTADDGGTKARTRGGFSCRMVSFEQRTSPAICLHASAQCHRENAMLTSAECQRRADQKRQQQLESEQFGGARRPECWIQDRDGDVAS